jgi:hypothetical protein
MPEYMVMMLRVGYRTVMVRKLDSFTMDSDNMTLGVEGKEWYIEVMSSERDEDSTERTRHKDPFGNNLGRPMPHPTDSGVTLIVYDPVSALQATTAANSMLELQFKFLRHFIGCK